MLQMIVYVGVAIMLAGGAKSAVTDDWADCKQRAKPDLIVRACTHIIESGKVSGEGLADAYNNRGVGYYIEGDYHRAIADYGAAIEIKPDYAIAHYNRGAAYLADEEPERALNEFRLVTRLRSPHDPWGRLALAGIEEVASRIQPIFDGGKSEDYRVDDVADDNVLNMRSGPGTAFPVVARIPPHGSGISVRTCKMVEGYRAKWCEVSWQNYIGWASACCLVSELTGLPIESGPP